MLGHMLLDRDRPALAVLEPADLGREGEGLGAHVDNWVLTDTFGPWVLGMAWRLGRVTDEWMWTWVEDADPWYRRLTLTATIAWNARSRGGVGDAERTGRWCAAAVDDRAPMVVKALSWALREWAGPQPEEVGRFLATWDDRLPALVRREVATRLRTGTKRGK
jgi:3-methyladenine DNA glycosylase AlkD